MWDELLHMDEQLLLAINGNHAPWADALFWQVSRPETWLPLYALLVVCLIVKFRRQYSVISSWRVPAVIVALLLYAVAVGGADLICAQIIKPLVARPRPTHAAGLSELVHVVNGYYGGAYGFCSNHAANTMACAVLSSIIFTYKQAWHKHLYITFPLVAWVILNCYSRMYLGVHYPLDILAGLVIGCVMALLAWRLGRGCLFPSGAPGHLDEEG